MADKGSSVPARTEIHHTIPRSLLRLYDICFWSEDAPGVDHACNEPREALRIALDTFELECRRYGLDHMDLSRGLLEQIIKASEIEVSYEQHRREIHAEDWRRWGRRGGLATLQRHGRDHFRRLALRRWGRAEA